MSTGEVEIHARMVELVELIDVLINEVKEFKEAFMKDNKNEPIDTEGKDHE